MGFFDRFRRQPAEQPVAAAPSPAGGVVAPHFAVIDVETTGLSHSQHRVLEIAIVTTDAWGCVTDEWCTRLNPQGPVGATHIHGITDADVVDAPLFTDVMEQVTNRLAGSALAAHNAAFDLAFLRSEYRWAGWELPDLLPTFCTLEASAHFLPRLDRRRLVDCCWALGVPLTDAHSALGDARATAGLLAAFMQSRSGQEPLPEHLSLVRRALGVAWPTEPSWDPVPWTPPAQHFSARAQKAMAAKAVSEPSKALVELVERFSLVDALDEGAPAGALAYLEKLAEVLEDGEISGDEAADLAAVADAVGLTDLDITATNQAFVLALAHEALEDGKVSRAERAELVAVAELLGVDAKLVPALLGQAEHARDLRLSAGLGVLPADWPHGEPLRVGDKVVFTGCDDAIRDALEKRSAELGVRIVGNVSAKTSLLVTDRTIDGTKAAKARELGTRTVHPDLYAELLAHLQPARPRVLQTLPAGPVAPAPRSEAAATFIESATREATTPTPAAVRSWARKHGFEVGVRGRLHKDVIDAYVAAQEA